MRFELTKGLPPYALSRGAPSTTRPPLRLALDVKRRGLPTGIWGRCKPEADGVAKPLKTCGKAQAATLSHLGLARFFLQCGAILASDETSLHEIIDAFAERSLIGLLAGIERGKLRRR